MKMGPIIASALICRSTLAFVVPSHIRQASRSSRLLSVSIQAEANLGVSRLETLQTLLSQHGAPGSVGCNGRGDLEPVYVAEKDTETPELISTMMGMDEYVNLHPHLFPVAKSKSTGNYICALKRAFADDAADLYENSSKAPWPLVEAKMGGPGMKLLALSSEHLMRRIVCECDFEGDNTDLIDMYNEGLGKNSLSQPGLDQPYQTGSVEKLGYGVDKYVLLRVGPFADIYENLALGHAGKGDESSSLISAEAASNKISGFASTFLFYARLLSSFPNREDESRDAARMCLRLPLPSIGLSTDEFKEVAVLGQLAKESDSTADAMKSLKDMYEKIREHEADEDPRAATNKTPEQEAIDEANYILDTVALTGGDWSEVRPQLAEIYGRAGRDDMAKFVNPTASD